MRTIWLRSMFRRLSIETKNLIHEDFYGDEERGGSAIGEVLDFLGIENISQSKISDAIRIRLSEGNQNSKQMGDLFENYRDWESALKNCWRALNPRRTGK
jgi:hypothetical protein